jgi:hypothetical protein
MALLHEDEEDPFQFAQQRHEQLTLGVSFGRLWFGFFGGCLDGVILHSLTTGLVFHCVGVE